MKAIWRWYLVTVRVSDTSTRDFPVRSHSAWAARVQFLRLRPGARVVAVRYREKELESA
jgi:hypothetical protein